METSDRQAYLDGHARPALPHLGSVPLFYQLTPAPHRRHWHRRCPAAAAGLHFASYNYVRTHGSLRVTPAMEAGISNRVWSVKDLIEAAG